MNVQELYPPPDLNFIGGGMFKEVGELFLRYLIDLAGLKPHERVLDVGCGIGRIAIPLTHYLNADGSYEGFDVVPLGIDWCRERITPHYPNFRFQLADVYNRTYYPLGNDNASEYVFPFQNRSFDLVVLTSVFTHLLPTDLTNYLYEIARVLKLGGRSFITIYLLNQNSTELIQSGKSSYTLTHRRGPCRFENPAAPEEAVAYDEPFVFALYERFGLTPRRPIHYGTWCGREGAFDYQDIIVADKSSAPSRGAALSHRLGRLCRSLVSWPHRVRRGRGFGDVDPSAAARAIAEVSLTLCEEEYQMMQALWELGRATLGELQEKLHSQWVDRDPTRMHKMLESLSERGHVMCDGMAPGSNLGLYRATTEMKWLRVRR